MQNFFTLCTMLQVQALAHPLTCFDSEIEVNSHNTHTQCVAKVEEEGKTEIKNKTESKMNGHAMKMGLKQNKTRKNEEEAEAEGEECQRKKHRVGKENAENTNKQRTKRKEINYCEFIVCVCVQEEEMESIRMYV